VFLLVVLTDKIKGIYTIPPQDAKIQIIPELDDMTCCA
jgi:hypothetical protein